MLKYSFKILNPFPTRKVQLIPLVQKASYEQRDS